MTRSLGAQSHVVVVDAKPQDYLGLTQVASQRAWHVHFLTSGRAAIRFAQPDFVDLWMINVCLPDTPGWDLVEQLRQRVDRARVFVVADQYHPQDERQACSQGASLYLCKDAKRSIDCMQLLELLDQPDSAAPRATTDRRHGLDRTDHRTGMSRGKEMTD